MFSYYARDSNPGSLTRLGRWDSNPRMPVPKTGGLDHLPTPQKINQPGPTRYWNRPASCLGLNLAGAMVVSRSRGSQYTPPFPPVVAGRRYNSTRLCTLEALLLLLVPRQGFEPRFAGPEPAVLPVRRSRNVDAPFLWMGCRDSNPNWLDQNQQSYRWTTPQNCENLGAYTSRSFDGDSGVHESVPARVIEPAKSVAVGDE